MDANFQRSLSAVLKHEGGYVDHPSDPGGATNLGITIGTAKANKLDLDKDGDVDKADVKLIKPSDAAPIYKARYWNKVKGDALPSGLDYAMFDFAVNSGPDRAVKMLQRIVGVTPDGAIGPITLAAIERIGATAIIGDLCAQRLAWLQGLKTWPTFGKGWGRRVAEVRAEALSMTAAKPAEPPKPAPSPPPSREIDGVPVGAIIAAIAILAALAAALFFVRF